MISIKSVPLRYVQLCMYRKMEQVVFLNGDNSKECCEYELYGWERADRDLAVRVLLQLQFIEFYTKEGRLN